MVFNSQIRLAGTVQDSIVDGPGMRYVVFVQGCATRCPGCHNPETWALLGGKIVEIDDIINEMYANPLTSGLTLSGGEPFMQADKCLKIARAARARGMNIWCYTGYTFDVLYKYGSKSQMALLEEVDILVDGKFEIDKRTLSLPWRGSTNQRLIDVRKSLDDNGTVHELVMDD